MVPVLLISTLVVSVCGLVYELTAATIASYLLGDSITQFSTVIGVYLFGMGLGSYLSKFIHGRMLEIFIRIELLVAAVGGSTGAILFLSFGYVESFRIVLYGLVLLIGILVGLEIPVLMRILKDRMEFHDVVSKVLSFDYVGALIASILFPLVFVPQLGLMQTSFFFGIVNALVACWMVFVFRDKIIRPAWEGFVCGLVTLCLVIGFVYSDTLLDFSEINVYPDTVIYAKSSPYQRIVLTNRDDDLRLYLNGHLQFSSRDEYRYHEALVHVGFSSVASKARVLILGGGDGMALREVLRYPEVEQVTLVDLDPAVTALFRGTEMLRMLNQKSLDSEKVTIVNQDAFTWVRDSKDTFDYIVIDFPDPTSFSIGKLYSDYFFSKLSKILKDGGMIAVQATSPLLARQSYWCVVRTLQAAGFSTMPFHVYVPSFTEWGFILAAKNTISLAGQYPEGLRFLTPGVLEQLRYFPPDMSYVETEVNKLTTQVLVKYYDQEWSRYN